MEQEAVDLNISYSYNKKVRIDHMKIETTKMSSKGQIVIPQDVRAEIRADEGTIFLVMASGDTLILKKVAVPSKETIIKELEAVAKEGRKRAESLGIKEKDVSDMIHALRKSKRQHAHNA